MPRRIVVVGGVGAGASAAVRARRLDESARITIFEKSGYVSFANCGLPYYVGGIIADRAKLLVQTPELFHQRFRIDVRVGHEVTAIDRQRTRVEVANLPTGETSWEPYDRLILCPGAEPVIPRIDGADAPNIFGLHNMEDTDAIHEYLEKHNVEIVAVVGAGFIGLEMADALTHRGLHVHLVEMLDQVLAPLDADMAAAVENHLFEKGVTLHLGAGLQGLTVSNGLVTQVGLSDGTHVDADMVLMSIGVRPNSMLAAEAGLDIGERRGIKVDQYMRTSDPNIYAAGDAVEIVHAITGQPTLIPLAGPANKHGRIAGENAVADRPVSAAKVFATAIVQVFDLAVGSTGLSVKAAERAGISHRHAVVRRADHATYYPGATPMRIKLVYNPDDRRVLGAQIVGKRGVDRRLDVIASVLHFGGTIDDLAELDLAYAPQFGSAKDPVNIAAFVAQNQERGLVTNVDPAEVERLIREGHPFVDVRTTREFRRGSVPNAINIPLDELRERAGEVLADRPIVVCCRDGQRSYIAERILRAMGRKDVLNLAGGLSWYDEQQR